jgi:hypothetical protein
MTNLTLRAFWLLLSFEFAMARRNFASLYATVRTRAVDPRAFHPDTCGLACGAVDRACVFYFKEVQCLQRSAATVCLLRDLGVSANLVIGAQHLPFRAHAWAEVDGRVVNDEADVTHHFPVLDRC